MPSSGSDASGTKRKAVQHGRLEATLSRPDLAAACHDLRQPLQSLMLLHGLLEKSVDSAKARALVARIGISIGSMTAVLDGLSGTTQTQPGFGGSTPARLSQAPVAKLPARRADTPADGTCAPVVFVVDDDENVRAAIRCVLEDEGRNVEEFASCEAFLDFDRSDRDGCLLVDAYLPGMSGLELLQHLQSTSHTLPAVMITGNSDVPMAVEAMKAGAMDFIEKPIGRDELLACIARALDQSQDQNKRLAWRQDAVRHVEGLTARQRQIMDLVLAGQPSKNIAADLGISQRTVENHRAAIMRRTGTTSLPALARLAVVATAARSDAGSGDAA